MNLEGGLSRVPDSMKPGMSHVVQAGETLVIRDSEGQEIAVEAREHEATIAFVRAYDEHRLARARGVGGPVLASLEHALHVAFSALPSSVHRRLSQPPSLRLP